MGVGRRVVVLGNREPVVDGVVLGPRRGGRLAVDAAGVVVPKDPSAPSYGVDDDVKPAQDIVPSSVVMPEPRSTFRLKNVPFVMPLETYSFTLAASEPV